MPYKRNYPRTAQEVLNPPVVFKQSTIGAVTNFKINNPWEGSIEDRFAKFRQLNDDLNKIYGKSVSLEKGRINFSDSGSSYFNAVDNVIVLKGRLSVITYLHEYAHVLGKDERQAVRWSLNLFKQVFPDKFARLGFMGHVAVKKKNVRVVSHRRRV